MRLPGGPPFCRRLSLRDDARRAWRRLETLCPLLCARHAGIGISPADRHGVRLAGLVTALCSVTVFLSLGGPTTTTQHRLTTALVFYTPLATHGRRAPTVNKGHPPARAARTMACSRSRPDRWGCTPTPTDPAVYKWSWGIRASCRMLDVTPTAPPPPVALDVVSTAFTAIADGALWTACRLMVVRMGLSDVHGGSDWMLIGGG